MAYDEKVAELLRKAFKRRRGVEEKNMFGGVAFMYRRYMCAGVIDDMIVIRVGPDEYENALSEPHTRPMDFTGKPMKGYVYVEPKGYKSEKDLKNWIESGIKFVKTLPPKN